MREKTVKAYRFFDVQDDIIRSRNGDLEWPAPNGRPGKWVRHEGEILWCQSGLYASHTIVKALHNAQGSRMGVVEARRIERDDGDKFAAREMRIVEVYEEYHLRGLAVLAASMVWPIYAKHVKDDLRPLKCLETTVAWMAGEVDDAAWAAARAAARDAAWDAARAAARDAARDAAWAAFEKKFNRRAKTLLSKDKEGVIKYLRKELASHGRSR